MVMSNSARRFPRRPFLAAVAVVLTLLAAVVVAVSCHGGGCQLWRWLSAAVAGAVVLTLPAAGGGSRGGLDIASSLL